MRSIWLLSTGFISLLASVPVAQAGCTVPASVDGHAFVSTIDEHFSPFSAVKVRFDADRYVLESVHQGKIEKGTYHYTRLSENVGQLDMQDDPVGNAVQYAMTLVCLGARTGSLVTTKWQGADRLDIRQSVGHYHQVQ